MNHSAETRGCAVCAGLRPSIVLCSLQPSCTRSRCKSQSNKPRAAARRTGQGSLYLRAALYTAHGCHM